MNCSEVRARLAGLLYGDLTAEEGAAVETHLTTCPACRREYAGLEQVRSALALTPVPEARVDLARLYRDAADRQTRRLRRWRRAAVALAGVAAALLAAVWLRLEVRLDGRQLSLRWGAPPAPEKKPPAPRSLAVRPVARLPEDVEERLRVMDELIHALSADLEQRDASQQERLVRLREGLDALREQTRERWKETERAVAALCAAQLNLTKGGD
jgi:hypothetical protein